MHINIYTSIQNLILVAQIDVLATYEQIPNRHSKEFQGAAVFEFLEAVPHFGVPGLPDSAAVWNLRVMQKNHQNS